MPYGCYRREVFDKIGFLNENLVRCQDIEFNARLRKAGGRILLVPDIVIDYYVRSDLRSYCKNRFLTGFWVIYHFKFARTVFSLRHLIPMIFVLGLVGLLALSISPLIPLWSFLPVVGLYLLANIYFALGIAVREKDFRYLLTVPVIFMARHFSYGLGSIWGIIRLFKRETKS